MYATSLVQGEALSLHPLQDVYYLLEIDPWGRRFYHRGGMRTGADFS